MPWYEFFWNAELLDHIAEHGLTPEEFEDVVQYPEQTGTSRSTGKFIARGYTATGKYVVAVYEMLDPITVYPITAFEVDDEQD